MGWQDRQYAREPAMGGGLHMGAWSVTTWLLAINAVVFLLDTVLSGSTRAAAVAPHEWGAFSIRAVVGQWQLWRAFTYQFLHVNFLHLVFNLIGLYFFGRLVEQWWGGRRFLAFYLLCGVSGAVVYTLLWLIPGALAWTGPDSRLVGASGSIFGILVGAAVVAPDTRVMLIFPPIPMRMRTMAMVFLGLAVLGLLVGSQNAGGEAAHLGGAALGFLLVKQPWLLNWAGDARQVGRPGWLARRRQSRLQKKVERARRDEAALEAEVDRILVKVKEHGLHSLSEREKKTLRRATERQREAG